MVEAGKEVSQLKETNDGGTQKQQHDSMVKTSLDRTNKRVFSLEYAIVISPSYEMDFLS